MPDLPLNFLLRLGGHVELPNKIFHKPAARLCRELSWRRRNAISLDEIHFVLVRFDHISGFVPAVQALATVFGPGDASEAFLRIAARNRLL